MAPEPEITFALYFLAWRRFLTLLGAFCDRQNISGASKMRIKSQYSVWLIHYKVAVLWPILSFRSSDAISSFAFFIDLEAPLSRVFELDVFF